MSIHPGKPTDDERDAWYEHYSRPPQTTTPPAPPALTAAHLAILHGLVGELAENQSLPAEVNNMRADAVRLALAALAALPASAPAVPVGNDGGRCPVHPDRGPLCELCGVATVAAPPAVSAPPPDAGLVAQREHTAREARGTWLIERNYAGTPLYWTGRAIHREPLDPDRLGEWSPDVNRALRFARRTDAACMLTWHCLDQGRVVEHIFLADELVAAQSAPTEET